MRKTIAFACIFCFLSLSLMASSHIGLPFVALMMKVPFGDKIVHFCLLGTISFFLNKAYPTSPTNYWGMQWTTISLILLAFVSIEEGSQLFIEGRNFELLDVLCNTLGIYTFQYLANYLNNWRMLFWAADLSIPTKGMHIYPVFSNRG